jgi:O-antigen ligase
MRISTFTTRAESCARAGAIAVGFSLPISVALDNVLLASILVLWIASADFPARFVKIAHNRVAIAALALFALFIAGLAYGTRNPGDGLNYLVKYADLAFIPIFVTLFNTERARQYAWLALASAMALTLVLSCLLWSGAIAFHTPGFGDRANPAVFKHYLTQNVLMAFGALVFAQLARIARVAWQRNIWSALAALAVVNIALMSQGRTGQLILVALGVYFVHSIWRWRGTLLATAGIAVVAGLLMLGGTNRFSLALDEIREWRPAQATDSSIGLRLGFYQNSVNLVREYPLLGSGTGSFPRAYAERVAGTAVAPTTNPHNEYLNIAVQLGVSGVLAMLYLFYCVWRYARDLPPAHEQLLARGLVITFTIGCLFNSWLMDHTEGLLFAWASGLLFAGLKPPACAAGTAR